MLGSSNTYRPNYFMDEDVVLVTLNYRLAAFGKILRTRLLLYRKLAIHLPSCPTLTLVV